jgi:hypothetical protein
VVAIRLSVSNMESSWKPAATLRLVKHTLVQAQTALFPTKQRPTRGPLNRTRITTGERSLLLNWSGYVIETGLS